MPGHELLTAAEMGRADALAIAAGVPGLELMENAGAPWPRRPTASPAGDGAAVAVVCGPGNNGGDGFVAARLLRERGYGCAWACWAPRGLKGDAAAMAARWGEPIEPLSPASLAGADLIIDALFGAGLSRPLEGVAADVVAAINASGKPVVAVDVPSGLDGTTGRADGPVVQATRTVTFFRLKPGHLLLPGRALCGERAARRHRHPRCRARIEIGPRTFANRPVAVARRLSLAAPRRPQVHARPRRRGLRPGREHRRRPPGRARRAARRRRPRHRRRPPAATAINATHATAVMVRAMASDAALAEFLADERRNAVLIGPGAGVGAGHGGDVLTVLASPAAVVLDADALTSFALAEEEAPVRAAGFGFVVRGAEPDPTGRACSRPSRRARRRSCSPRTRASSSACSASWPAPSSTARAAPPRPAARWSS